MVDKKHIISLQGKDFVTHAGLLEEAHKQGLNAINTDLVHQDEKVVIFKATVIIKPKDTEAESKSFTGYGDATPNNVNKNILPHMIRMAETRAVNRALRFATNIGMCSVEELGESKAENIEPTKLLTCRNPKCKAKITEKVAEFSKKKYGHTLCIPCQKMYNEEQIGE